jgi:ankyrin repeat protein
MAGTVIADWKRELGRACIADDGDKVRALLNNGNIDQNTRDAGIQLAIQKATSRKSRKSGKPSIAGLLLTEFNAGDLLPDEAFRTILLQLIDTDDAELLSILRMLLQRGYRSSLNEKDKKEQALHRTPLLVAALHPWKESLQILLDSGADLNTQYKNGETILSHIAADKDSATDNGSENDIALLDVVKRMVSRVANPYQPVPGEKNALHWAASTGKVEMVKILLRARPELRDVEASTDRGRTALHYAAGGACTDDTVVDLLLKAGARHDSKSDGHWTPLHNAAYHGNLKAVQRLLMAGADPNALLSSRVTPLHWAAANGHEGIVRCFLANKDVQRHKKDALGSTPLIWASQNGHKDIAKLFHPCYDAPFLSYEQDAACRAHSFRAAIVDFERSDGQGPPGHLVKRFDMWDVLYKKDFTISANPYPSESKRRRMESVKDRKLKQKSPQVESPDTQNEKSPPMTEHKPRKGGTKKKRFRWIHLPANNMAWVETLFNKLFIEEEAADVDSFKALQKTLGHQHRGRHPHST